MLFDNNLKKYMQWSAEMIKEFGPYWEELHVAEGATNDCF